MTLAIFNYPTHQMAMQQIAEFEKLPGAVVKRSGPMIAVVLAPPDPDFAEHLLGQCVTRRKSPATSMFRRSATIPGSCCITRLFSWAYCWRSRWFRGCFSAAMRSFRHRGKKGQEADAMITLDLW